MQNLRSLETAVLNYDQLVKEIKKLSSWSDKEAILALLLIRDRIQFFVDEQAVSPSTINIPIALISEVSNNDAVVNKWNKKLIDIEELPVWRKSVNPPTHHWWWHPVIEPPSSFSTVLLRALAILLLLISLTLIHDLLTRVLANAPGIWKSFSEIATTGLTIVITGSAFSKTGRALIKVELSKISRQPSQWPRITLCFLTGITGALLFAHSYGLSQAAAMYHEIGERQYFETMDFFNAEANLHRALELDPGFAEANHTLALIYEDAEELDKAKIQYRKAARAGLIVAVNNLARLQITDEKNYSAAAVRLLVALDSPARDKEDIGLEYSLRKNLGWAFLEQSRFTEAEKELRIANSLEAQLSYSQPDAYCLLARALEERGSLNETLALWTKCLGKVNRPEHDPWKEIADRAIKASKERRNRTQNDQLEGYE